MQTFKIGDRIKIIGKEGVVVTTNKENVTESPRVEIRIGDEYFWVLTSDLKKIGE